MVDPADIPPKLTRQQVEYFILFGIAVANKPAKITEAKMNKFLTGCTSPFEHVRYLVSTGRLSQVVRAMRFGQYTRISQAFEEAASLNLDEPLTIERLEAIHGIGPKTARYIILYTDPQANCAALDTHILKWLRKQGHQAPKSTPPAGLTYQRLELAFQQEAAKLGLSVRELDNKVWMEYSGYKPNA